MVKQRKLAESGVYAKVETVETARGKITPHTIAVICMLLIAAAIVATGIGLTQGNASSINDVEAKTSTNETASESSKTSEESRTTKAETEIEEADSYSSSGATTTTTATTNFEDPVTLGVEVEVAAFEKKQA